MDVEDSGDKLRYVISRNATPACVLLEQDGVKEAVENRSSVEMSASAWTMVRCVTDHLERICNINAIYNIFPNDDSNPRP